MDEIEKKAREMLAAELGAFPESCTREVVMTSALRAIAAALEAAREDACVALVADIRFACGDNGKRMQPELVEFIRGLAEDAAKWRESGDRK